MTRTILVTLTMLTAVCVAGAQPLPEAAEPLNDLMSDETRALEALRAFDRVQMALLDWDIALARDLQAEGDRFAAQTKVEEARARAGTVRTAYEAFLEAYPKNALAHNYYGELLYDRFGEQAAGLQQWKLALMLDENLARAANNLAIHYAHAGDYMLAFRHLDKALDLDPENPDYLFNAVQIYLTNSPQAMDHYGWDQEKLYKEAMKMSRLAAEQAADDFQLVQDYAVNFFAAERFGVEANWQDAADAWKQTRALADSPGDVYFTWLNEARAAIEGGMAERAAACLAQARALRPESPAIDALEEKVSALR
jgi:tetratricopeptide (TPR) repeat protein